MDDTNVSRRIHNPVTGEYYEIRRRSSRAGDKNQIKGLWSSSPEYTPSKN